MAMRRALAKHRTALVLVALLVTAMARATAAAEPVLADVAAADAYVAAGEVRRAQAVLERAQAALPADAPAPDRALVLARLGAVVGDAGEDERALALLQEAAGLARGADRPDIEAAALNDLGNVQIRTEPAAALASYTRAAELAGQAGQQHLRIRALINGARAERLNGETATAASLLGEATARLDTRPAGGNDALERLAVAAQGLALAQADPAYLEEAARLQDAAVRAAEASGSRRDLSWATGQRGDLYALAGRDEDALRFYRQAALDAEQAGAPELLFRWQWFAGRILAAQGRREEAIAAYRSAVRNLELVRLDLPAFDPQTGRSLFRQTLGPVFTELADLLLQEASGTDGVAQQVDLSEARAVIEQLKTVELEDYFKDDCAADLTSRVKPVDNPGERTAVLYPVLLDDRTELILSLPDGRLVATRSGASGPVISELAQRFRGAIGAPPTSTDGTWLRLAVELDRQLIKPVEPLLQEYQIETLVFVPDGALRTIPIAALHDGTYFVAERYAVATSLGLNLLDTRPLAERKVDVLLGGLSESVAGAAALPGVATEIDALNEVLGARRVLMNQDFVKPELDEALGRTPFNVIHLATHGVFASRPEDSYLLTYDGRLDMNELAELVRLSQFRDEPVEILTLSACTTAAGDDRSALGLAGLAVKTGARSALATLWEVDDRSTSLLMPSFYENLLEPGVNKAEALRRAQREIMADRGTVHPFYWAPFLLIGNWT
jgi:CHAT domain-containing protein